MDTVLPYTRFIVVAGAETIHALHFELSMWIVALKAFYLRHDAALWDAAVTQKTSLN
jgi:hypothetical protein